MNLASIVTFVAASAFAGGALAGDKPKPSVEFARTWDEALAEAQFLNVPIVVHNHGFHCPPCWGMHASVLQNKDYIKFAEKNSVEVIYESSLKEGVDAKEKNAETFKGKRDGVATELMFEWPNLTLAEMLAFETTDAGQYNKTGFVPYTCIVDPYTRKEMTQLPGATSAAKIEEAVLAARKELEKTHGAGLTRKQLADLEAAETDSADLASKGEYAKAIAAIAKLDVAEDAPALLADRVEKAKAIVLAAAQKALDDAEAIASADPAEGRKELNKLIPKLAGTGLEARAKETLGKL